MRSIPMVSSISVVDYCLRTGFAKFANINNYQSKMIIFQCSTELYGASLFIEQTFFRIIATDIF